MSEVTLEQLLSSDERKDMETAGVAARINSLRARRGINLPVETKGSTRRRIYPKMHPCDNPTFKAWLEFCKLPKAERDKILVTGHEDVAGLPGVFHKRSSR